MLSLHPTNLRSTTNCLITQSFIIQSHRIDSIRSHTPSSLCLCFISAVFLLRHCYSSIPLSPRSLIIYLSSVIARLFILHYSVSLHPPSVPPYLKQCCNYASSSHYRSVPLCPSSAALIPDPDSGLMPHPLILPLFLNSSAFHVIPSFVHSSIKCHPPDSNRVSLVSGFQTFHFSP